MSVIYKNGTYYGAGGGGEGADTEIIADDFDPTESYAVGEYAVYEGVLYKCTTAHTGAWDASDFEDTQVMAEMPTPMPAADMSDIVTPLPGVMNRRRIYSPEEQVVGEWREYFSGVLKKKPVYEKTFFGVTHGNVERSWTNIVSVPNVEYLLDAKSIRTDSNDIKVVRFYYSYASNGYIQYWAINTSSGCNVLTIQYTKTTDEWEVV